MTDEEIRDLVESMIEKPRDAGIKNYDDIYNICIEALIEMVREEQEEE